MKRFFYTLFVVLAFVACSESDVDNGGTNSSGQTPSKQPEITLSTTATDFSTDGGSNVITFTSSEAWTAEIVNSRADEWCSIDPTSGPAGSAKITVTTTANDTPDDRTASVIIKAGTTSKTINVSQKKKVAERGHNTEPYFSETVELMGLIFRLAGAKEYKQCHVSSVANSADSYFAPFKNHKAVELANECRRTGVGYDAVTGYGCQLIFNDKGEIIFDTDYQEGSNPSFDRWTDQQKNDMLAAVNDFYKESKFHDWFISTQSEQQKAITSFKTVANVDYTWFDSFYGKNDKLASRIILSFMIGGHNNGISLKRKDGTLLLTPVMGSLRQQNESISYNGGMETIIHEFSHPYCNPLIEANWNDIFPKALEVYSIVEELMTNQAYGSALTMMCETLVRASTIRYMKSHNMEDMANRSLANHENLGFIMIRTLVKTLEKREREADKYPTLADFMPEIVAAINQFDPNRIGMAEPDTLPKEYVDLGIVMDNGKKLYFATRNVGETSPAGFGTNVYRWGAVIEGGKAWVSDTGMWPKGHKLDAAHDIATITWGEEWHTPSIDEWTQLAEQCDYERKEADESGYGVAGYFFYNKADHSKFIFLPVSSNNELRYWTSQIKPYIDSATGKEYTMAQIFNSYNGDAMCGTTADLSSSNVAVRPVFVESFAINNK